MNVPPTTDAYHQKLAMVRELLANQTMKPTHPASSLTTRDVALLVAWHALVQSSMTEEGLTRLQSQANYYRETLPATLARSASDLAQALFAKEDKP